MDDKSRMIAALAYYFGQKKSSKIGTDDKAIKSDIKLFLEEYASENRDRYILIDFFTDYCYSSIGETITKDEFEEYLSGRDDFSGNISGSIEEILPENLTALFDKEITEELAAEVAEEVDRGKGFKYIKQKDLTYDIEKGIYIVDFVDQKLTAYIEDNSFILFNIKTPEDRDQIKYTLLPKKELIKEIGSISEVLGKELKDADKAGEYWIALKDILNSFVGKNIVDIKTSPDSITVSRKKIIDEDIALDNLMEIVDDEWREIIEELNHKPNKQIIKAFAEKMKSLLQKEGIPENDFVSVAKGRIKLVNVDDYIAELFTSNQEIAEKITKGDSEKISISIIMVLDIDEVINPSDKLIKKLEEIYAEKRKYRGKYAAIDGIENKEGYAPFNKLLKKKM